jgi:RNA polymerase sigma factor (sigma-70 family)
MADDGGSDCSERVSFEGFFTRVEPRLHAALRALYGADLGREATAEAMAWSFEHWDRVRTMEYPVSFLYRVGRTRTRRLRRRWLPTQVREQTTSIPEVDPRLAGALERLSERQRVAVMLVHGHDWSQGDVAALMGIDTSTVATHVARALQRLRRELEVHT